MSDYGSELLRRQLNGTWKAFWCAEFAASSCLLFLLRGIEWRKVRLELGVKSPGGKFDPFRTF